MANKLVTRGIESAIEYVIDAAGAVISTGVVGDVEVPFNFYLEEATLLADQDGAIKVDIWADTYGNYPPTNADTITGGNEPEIAASGKKDQDTTLTGWTRELSKGQTLRFNVDSVTTITRCIVSLKGIKT